MSALYNMEHNVDSTGAQVVVAKTATSKTPDLRLRDQIRGDLEMEPRKSILKRDTNSLDDPNSKVNLCVFIAIKFSFIVSRLVLIVAEVKALRRGKRSTRKLKEEYSSKSRMRVCVCCAETLDWGKGMRSDRARKICATRGQLVPKLGAVQTALMAGLNS
jgi:hypothetical protein